MSTIRKAAPSIFVYFILAMANLAHAAGLEKVDSTLQTIYDTMLATGVIVCSLAFVWVGYNLLFQHVQFGEVAQKFIGALFIGGSSAVAGLLLG
jgi:uncharacterized membrane protein YjjB (DUF3815 family)